MTASLNHSFLYDFPVVVEHSGDKGSPEEEDNFHDANSKAGFEHGARFVEVWSDVVGVA